MSEVYGSIVNTNKAKIIVLRIGGILKRSDKWVYKGEELKTVTYYIILVCSYPYIVIPIILYCSEIWGVKRYEQVENVHIKLCKIV